MDGSIGAQLRLRISEADQAQLAAQRRMQRNYNWYDYKTDPLYDAANKIRAKRREKYLSRGPSLWRGPQRDSRPPPTNGESK